MACSPDWSVINADSLGERCPHCRVAEAFTGIFNSRHDGAQLFFDRGMNLYYGFHIIESMASFIKAAQFDPENPMIHWGKALAYGPNINDMEYLATPEALESAAGQPHFPPGAAVPSASHSWKPSRSGIQKNQPSTVPG